MAAPGDHPVCLSLRSRRAIRPVVSLHAAAIRHRRGGREGSRHSSYLSRREAAHAGVKPGLAKTVIWNDPTAPQDATVARLYSWILSQSKGYRSGRREPRRHARRQRLSYPARRARPRDIRRIRHGHLAGLAERCPRSASHRTESRRSRDPDRNLDRRAAGDDGGARGQVT